MTDLFEHRRQAEIASKAPLADRMRPRSLEEFAGQGHIVGPGRLLRRAIEADQLSSLIFYGPPGTGKTTLARIIAGSTEAHFTALNAVLAGVKDIRAAVADARDRLGMRGRRTILFVDEVHRFNKAQQDALLPWVENGTVIFVGATTENPYFEVNKALVSRSRVFQLRPLVEADLRRIARMAVEDEERGFGDREVDLHEDALEHLVDVANGDARAVLNALELAVESTAPDERGRIVVDLRVAEESIQRRAVLYDKEGDAHYDTISAFIKSVRGSDADASLYWMARMIYAGEDPRFIFRRMLILASEDVGLADPRAVEVVMSCARAFDYVGLPEGQFHLSQAALYLATAPKSNSTLAYFDALGSVQKERVDDVPSHLKDNSRDGVAFGHGEGYQYPHAYRDHWVAQQYLPGELQGRVFYQPSDQGYEAGVRETTLRRREAQLAAMLEPEAEAFSEGLTFTGADAARDRERWLARAVAGSGARLEALRDRLMAEADISRHDRVLDLRAGTGLLTWEALRRAPEGGVWARAEDAASAEVLERDGAGLDALDGPTVLVGPVQDLPALLALRGESELRFEAVLGWRSLGSPEQWGRTLEMASALLAEDGRMSLAEPAPGAGSRPSDLLLPDGARAKVDGTRAGDENLAEAETETRPEAGLPEWLRRLREAEAEVYAADAGLAWSALELRQGLERAGLRAVAAEAVEEAAELLVTHALVARWFEGEGSYGARMAVHLDADTMNDVRARFEALVGGPARPWRAVTVFASARAARDRGAR